MSDCNGIDFVWPFGKNSFKTLFERLLFSNAILVVKLGTYPDLIKFPYFADTTERGDRGRKQKRIGVKQRVTFMDNYIT